MNERDTYGQVQNGKFRIGNMGMETWEWKHRTQDMYGHTVISYGYKMPHS